MANKDTYLNKERKHNADFMRKSGHSDVLSTRKSIGRKGDKLRNMAKKVKGLEGRSKKTGFYVHGHKNLGDVYEA